MAQLTLAEVRDIEGGTIELLHGRSGWRVVVYQLACELAGASWETSSAWGPFALRADAEAMVEAVAQRAGRAHARRR